MQKVTQFLRYGLPALLWMILIFSFSSDQESSQHSSRLFEPLVRWLFPQMPPQQVEAIHYAFRKCCHLTEYAILALLLWRAIRHWRPGPLLPWRWTDAGLALAGVFLYAASDEIHQIFVPTRTSHFSDVLIDTAGGAVALTLLWLIRRWWHKQPAPASASF